MKFLLIAAWLSAPAMVAGAALEVKEPSQFIVEVKGIVCSFCAYGARKNLSRMDFLDRSKFKEGLLMETEKGAITGAIAQGKKIDFQKIFKAIQKGGYEILAIHMNLMGVPEKRDSSVLLVNKFNGQEFLLLGEDGQPWNMKNKQGKEVSVRAYVSGAVLAKTPPAQPLAVTVKDENAASP